MFRFYIYFVWHLKHFINFIHLILPHCAVCCSGIIFTLLIRRFTFAQSQAGVGIRTGLRAPDVTITGCLLMVAASTALSLPSVTLQVRPRIPFYRHLFVSDRAKPCWMCGVVCALTKGYHSFQIVEQVSCFKKPKWLKLKRRHVSPPGTTACIKSFRNENEGVC